MPLVVLEVLVDLDDVLVQQPLAELRLAREAIEHLGAAAKIDLDRAAGS